MLLDEPSSGLDPIVRRDILGAVIRTVADEGRTVLFSSHLLHEVERVADRVALIDRGRVVFSGALDQIKGTHHRLTLRFAEPPARPDDPLHRHIRSSLEKGLRRWSVPRRAARASR